MMIASCCRRALLGVSFGVLATLSAFSANADQITFVSQGGAYQKAQTIAILDPSAKKLGITINQDSIPDAWRQRQADLGRRRRADRLLSPRRRAGPARKA